MSSANYNMRRMFDHASNEDSMFKTSRDSKITRTPTLTIQAGRTVQISFNNAKNLRIYHHRVDHLVFVGNLLNVSSEN